MKELIAILAAFAEAVAARQTHEFEWLVKSAYAAGAGADDLLAAIEIGQLVGDSPEPVVAEASTTVHLFQWMSLRPDAPGGRSKSGAAWPKTRISCTTR